MQNLSCNTAGSADFPELFQSLISACPTTLCAAQPNFFVNVLSDVPFLFGFCVFFKYRHR